MATELLCSACQYDLRTLPESGRCPECGHPIARSRYDYDNRLAASAPRFRRAVRGALDALILAYVFAALCALEGVYVDYLGTWFTPVRQQLAMHLAPSILAVFACWRLGTREVDRPDRGFEPDAWFSNYALRVTAVCWFLPIPLMYGPFNRTFYWGDRYNWLLAMLYLCIVPAHFLFYRRLRRLALRLPSRAIARQTRVVMWLTFAGMLWTLFDVSFSYPAGLIWRLSDSPVPAAGDPFSVDRLLIRMIVYKYHVTSRGRLFLGLPAAVSVYAFVVVVRFRLALRRSERGGSAD